MEPLLPPRPSHPLACHNPRVPDRDAMNAILLVLRTGMQWNALNATGICSSSSAHRRFQEWVQGGVFEQFWRRGLLAYEQLHGVEWEWLSCDGLLGKAPLGGDETGPNPTDRAKRGEALAALRRQGRPARGRDRWRERERLQTASLDARADRDRPTGRQPG
jgi:transposase